MILKLYPDQRRGAAARAAGDVLVLAWTVAAIVAAVIVRQLVLQLGEVAQAVIDAGNTLNSWLEAFRITPAANIPLVGSALSDYIGRLVDGLQGHSGNRVVALGTGAAAAIPNLALALAVTVAVLAILVVTPHYVLWRWRDSRARGDMLAYVQGISANGQLQQAYALLALRATATLPLTVLARVSADPIADLRSGNHRTLSVALLAFSGIDEGRLAASTASLQDGGS